jgi:GNAT superfamily N-acetyltransferase
MPSTASTDLTLRAARREDLPALLRLYRELRPNDAVIGDGEVRSLWMRILADPRSYVFVAEVDGEPVSTCMLAMTESLAHGGKPFAVMEHVVTATSHRGRGIGRALLAHALDFAWSRNCYKVMLLSGAQRAEAHHVYLALGFDGDAERGFVVKPPR